MGWNPFEIIGDLFEEVVSWFVDIPESQGGVEINRSSRNDPIPVVYGRDKVKGANWAYWSTSGKDNRYLYIWAAFCEGEIDGFEEIWIDDKPLAEFKGINRSSYPDFAPWDGDTRVVIREYFGSDDQTSDALLQSADPRWTASHRLRGIAGLVIRLRWDDSYFSGLPQISAVVRGRKVLLANGVDVGWTQNAALHLRDYMTNTRFGRGLVWPTDFEPTVWQQAFTDCEDTETFFGPQSLGQPDEVAPLGGELVMRWDSRPANAVALAGAAILASGGATAESQTGFMSNGWYGNNGGYYLPYDNVVGTIDPTDTITISQEAGKLFSFNGTLNGGREFDTILDNIKRIRAVMRGNMPRVQGLWHLYVEKARAPVATIQEKDIIGGLEWSASKKGDRYNRVTVKFTNPSTGWKEDIAIWPEPGSPEEATLLAEDNDLPLPFEVSVQGIRNLYQAKDIARVICLKSRDNIQASFKADPWLLGYHCGQVVDLNWSATGWNDKPFMITQRGLTEDGKVILGVEEHTAAIYNYDPNVLDIIKDNTDLPDPFNIEPPANVTASTVIQRLEEKRPSQLALFIDVEFDRVDDEFVRGYQVRTRTVERFNLQTQQWVPEISAWTEHPQFDQVDEIEPKAEYFAPVTLWLRRYEVEARSATDAGSVSEWSQTIVHEVFLDTTAPEPPVINQLTPGAASIAVKITPDDDPDYAYAKIYINTVDDFATAAVGIEELVGTDGVIPSLDSEQPYWVWATSIDDVGNESGPSAVATTTTLEPQSPPSVTSPTEPDPAGYDEGTYWYNPTTGEVKTLRSGVWVDEPPAAPTNLRLTNPDPADPLKFQGTEAKFDWKGPEGSETLPFFWYDIEIWPSYPRDTPARKKRSEDRGGPASARFFQWSYQDAIDADPDGTAEAPTIKDGWRTFEVRVYTMWPDEVTRSTTYDSITVTNDQLQQITGFVATVEDRSIQIAHAPIEGSDFAGIEVHSSTSPGYTPDETTLRGVIYAGGDYQEIRGLIPGTGLRYLSLLGFDRWGKERGLMTKSAEVAVSLPADFGGLAYKGIVQTGDIQDRAVLRQKVAAGDIAETHYVASSGATVISPGTSNTTVIADYTFTAQGDGAIIFSGFSNGDVSSLPLGEWYDVPTMDINLWMTVNGGVRQKVSADYLHCLEPIPGSVGGGTITFTGSAYAAGNSDISLGPYPSEGDSVRVELEANFGAPAAPSQIRYRNVGMIITELNNI